MDIKTLQALVVEALEDVKAQDIRVYDTVHLTSMFDRIAIASGTSNRQTKALAASVRDKVKAAGGGFINMEGEGTGEWVLVDLGDMVVHIMQPAIRAYYRLEEIWGEKEVKMGAAKRAVGTALKIAQKTGVDITPVSPAKKVPAKKAATKTVAKTVAKKAPAKKSSLRKAPAKKAASRTAGKSASKSVPKVIKKIAHKTPAKTAGKPRTSAIKKTAAKKPGPKKPAAKKPALKKTTSR